MVNVNNIREALSHLEDTIIKQYADGERVFLTDSKLEYVRSKILDTNDYLRYVPGFETLKTSAFIRTEYSEVKDIKFCLVFKVNGFKTQKCNLSIPKIGFENLAEWLTGKCNDFIESESILLNLNSSIKKSQRVTGSECDVEYIGDYIRRDGVSLVDWGYRKLVFRVGMNLVLRVREYLAYQELDFSSSSYYAGTIKDVLVRFNEFSLHKKMGAKLEGNVKQLLCSSQMSMNDAIRNIMKNRLRKGTQEIKTCTYINELGEYIVLCNWAVDYKKRTIDISIIGNKIFDLSRNELCCQGDIYERIKARVQLPEERSPIIFGDMTVEEFIKQ